MRRDLNIEAGLSVTAASGDVGLKLVLRNNRLIVPGSIHPLSCARETRISLEPEGLKSEAVLGAKVELDFEVLYELVCDEA